MRVIKKIATGEIYCAECSTIINEYAECLCRTTGERIQELKAERALYEAEIKKDIELPLVLRYSRWISEIEWEIRQIKQEQPA